MRSARLGYAAAGLLAGLLALSGRARADVVELKNGNVMNGAVTRETSTELDLDIGYGAVTLKKSDIRRVRRADKGSRQRQDEELLRRRIENGEATPPGGQALFAAFRSAEERRDKALDSRAQADARESDRAALTADIKDLAARRQDALERLAQIDANASPQDYNAAVSEANDLGAQGAAKQAALEQVQDDSVADDQGTRSYLRAVDAFQRAYDAYAFKASSETKASAYFRVMSDELKRMEKDIRMDRAPVSRLGTSLVADVILNGKTHARLLVDTGASLVTLSPEILTALGPEAIHRGAITTTVADGRAVQAEAIELNTVEVGGTRARHVMAAVITGRLQGVDGLLGMSFLGRFSFESDPRAGALIFHRLAESNVSPDAAPSGR